MAEKSTATKLVVEPREVAGSRAVRRLRRRGLVPGVVYGGDADPESFQVDGRSLRQALAHSGAVLDLSIDGGKGQACLVKDHQRDPVKGLTLHVDLLRVRLDEAIQAQVILELEGVDESPGVKEGGVLEHITREVTVEALPTAIPDLIRHDVSDMEINDTITLESVKPPEGVTLMDDLETVVATVVVPRMPTEDDIEQETELVGEDGEPIEPVEGEEGEAPSGGEAAEGGERGESSGG